MKAKRFLAAALSVLMVFALAACNKPGGTPVSSDPGVTPGQPGGEETLAGNYDVKLWVAAEITDLTQKQVDAFNASNEDGIVINATIEAVGEGEAATQMITDVEAGGDIYCFAQDQFARLVQAGALAKLGNQAAEIVKSANSEDTVAAVTAGSELYGYPITSDNGYFMFYDKSVIPDSDIDSLEAIIKDCEDAGKYIAFNVDDSAWYAASFFFATGCKSEWTTDDDGKFTSVNDTFNSPEGLIALKGMQKLVTSKAFLGKTDQASEFASGAAVVMCGTWNYTAIEEILGDNMGASDLPSFEVDGKSYHLGSFKGYKLMGVKPQVDPKKQAVVHKLAQYLSGEECQLERFAERAWGPSNLNAQASPEVQANAGQVAYNLQAPYAIPQGQIHGSWWNIGKVIAEDVKTAKSDADLQAALDSYTEQIDALFELSGHIFVGAWNGWSNSDGAYKLDEADGKGTITLDVPDSDYMGGRIVDAGDWNTDHGFAEVTEGADLLDADAAGGDNNIVFKEAGNYTVTWDINANTISVKKN